MKRLSNLLNCVLVEFMAEGFFIESRLKIGDLFRYSIRHKSNGNVLVLVQSLNDIKIYKKDKLIKIVSFNDKQMC